MSWQPLFKQDEYQFSKANDTFFQQPVNEQNRFQWEILLDKHQCELFALKFTTQ